MADGPGVTPPSGDALRRVVDRLTRDGLLAGPVPAAARATSITADSRTAVAGSLFLAIPGTRTDGHRFVTDAVARGATLVMAEQPADGVPLLLVRDARRAAIAAARAWYDDPAERLLLIGVTGTNGKTTTTGLLQHLLNQHGQAGTIGTLGAFDGAGRAVASTAGVLTTPGPVDLHATFAALADRGVTRVVMEASSHSLDQGRLDGLVFAGAVFTNFTRDHLDYHHTMEAYLGAKLHLADLLSPAGVCAISADEPAWAALRHRPGVVTFGLGPGADVRAEGIVLGAEAGRFLLTGRFGTREATVPLPGDFNVLNALAAAACALRLEVPLDQVVERLASAPQVPGRMERLTASPCPVFRDYAHTPDALERALRALRPLTRGRLIVLFGAGGDRDRGKRPMMGRIAAELADEAIATSDNPRTEDPEQILDEVVAGAGRPIRRVVDRRGAIAEALAMAQPGDTILLAGKGHETYQVIGTVRHPFDEREIVRQLTGTA